MAYDTKRLKQQALEAIEKHKLFQIADVLAFIKCGKTAFYDHFPNESNDYKEIDDALTKNKVEVKSSLRSKWYKSNAPALQLALYKLIATNEERRALSMNSIEHTGEGGGAIQITIKDMS